MNALHEYISKQVIDHLTKRRVVVWYDSREEFRPYIRDLRGGVDVEDCKLEQVQIGEVSFNLCEFTGSFFEVKFAVEPVVSADNPEPLLVYVPGVERDRVESLLMELEKAGHCHEPQLKRQARNVLRQQYSDGQIDEMLASDSVTYEDIVELLKAENGRKSMLKVIFEGARDNADLIADWIADPGSNAILAEKSAGGELFKLVESRLGLELADETDLDEARTKTLRYVLVGEFRDDFEGEPPTATAMIPVPQTKEHVRFVRDVAQALRQQHGDAYVEIADKVEADLRLSKDAMPPELLGKIDTFRFEEGALLHYVGQLICDRQFDKARVVVRDHRRSFWTDREPRRWNQWEACRLMTELGSLALAVRDALPSKTASPMTWIQAYTAEDGWYRLDWIQRNLEALIASMTEEPESEDALNQVRSDYEQTLQEMATGFAEALHQANWSIPEAICQTQVYPDLVKGKGGPVAYIMVDSMRYEMGVELRDQLKDADELKLEAAVAAIPTITSLGMAALLPGASASFSVTEDGAKLAAEVDGSKLSGLPSRLKFLKSRVPGVIEMELGKLLEMTKRMAEKKIGDAPLVVIRSQDIDAFGESGSNHVARQIMDTAIGNVARAVRKLADLGIENFVVCADHGHLFISARDESMRIESPGGETVELHRRCWVGRGGITPKGTIRVSGAELGYGANLDFVFPTGIAVFKAGGDLAYHHGGLSLQELLVPVLTVRMVRHEKEPAAEMAIKLGKLPETLTNRTLGITISLSYGLFGNEPIVVRPVLLRGGIQVGEAGMAMDAEFDQRTRCVRLEPGKTATVAMLLQSEDCDKVRVVVQDPTTDAVLAQSNDIPVNLGI